MEKSTKKISFFRLFMRSLPEIWFLQVVIGVVLWFPMTALNTVFMALSTSGDFSVTTAIIKTFLSPRVLEMLACCFLMVLLLIIGEIFAPIFLSVAIQKQEKIRVFSIIKKSIKALPCLFTPTGFLILLYILFVSPLIGMGVYLSMTEHLYLPHFISEVIDKNMATAALYRWAIIILTLLGFIHIFVFHGILLDGDCPWDAMHRSRQYFVKHWKTLLIAFIQLFVIIRILFMAQEFIVKLTWINPRASICGSRRRAALGGRTKTSADTPSA